MTANTTLEVLIPLDRRRPVWAALRFAGLRVPSLALSPTARWTWGLSVVAALVGLCLWTGRWWPPAIAFVPVWCVAFRTSRPWAVHLPQFVRTVGELAVYGTRFGDHAGSGYRWTHGDVLLKVRLVLAESLGLPLEEVRPESTFRELGAW